VSPAADGRPQWFAVHRGEITGRWDVNYWASTLLFNKRYATPLYPLEPLSKGIAFVQYGSSDLANSEGRGLRMIRMNNLQADGWDFSDIKYVPLGLAAARHYRLKHGDVLFNRTNSKELVGKCEVFRERGVWVFASYLIRVRFNEKVLLPDFAATFLNTSAGRLQIDRTSRQIIGMTNVNAEELQSLVIPLPDTTKQAELVASMDAARETRRAKLAEAEALLAGLDGFLLDILGLTLPPEDGRKTFAVTSQQLLGRRIDPPAYQPIFAKGHPPKTPLRPLREVADLDANTLTKPAEEATLVPYVGLPECEQTEVREIVMRPYSEVKGRSVVRPGDILFARIEPSVFNQKYVFVEDLKGHPAAYTSTEFYVVTARSAEVNVHYLYAMFFCSFVFAQAKGKTTGSSGRRRLDPEMFAELQIPVPLPSVQETVAIEVRRRREEARRLRTEAEAAWQAAKRWFEDQLLGGVQA
jgi:type I restriction enzyme, S subunit